MDYYSILGLPRDCSLEDIKKSYKKLSLIYHPDISNGNSEKFILIKEAYEYLKDNHEHNSDQNYAKVWSELFKKMSKKKNICKNITIPISWEESFNSFEKDININFEIPCSSCSVVTKSLCKKCNGVGFFKENVSKKIYFLKIESQDQIFNFDNFYKGIDLRVKIHVNNTVDFKFKNKITETTENISIFKAILGGPFKIKTLYGEETISLPQGNIADFNYILEKKGLFNENLLIKLKVFLPKNLTNNQKQILNNLIYEENE